MIGGTYNNYVEDGNWRNTEAAELGAVLLTCHLDQTSINTRMQEPPQGQEYFYPNNQITRDCFDVEAGDIVLMRTGYGDLNKYNGVPMLHSSVSLNEDEQASDHPLVIGSLNGITAPVGTNANEVLQRKFADTFMNEYMMMGVALRYDDSKKNDMAIVVQKEGIRSFINRSNKPIYPGDRVRAVLPLPRELASYPATKGANGEKYGRIPIMMEPVTSQNCITVQDIEDHINTVFAPAGRPGPRTLKQKVADAYADISGVANAADLIAALQNERAEVQRFISAIVAVVREAESSSRIIALSAVGPGQQGDFLLRA